MSTFIPPSRLVCLLSHVKKRKEKEKPYSYIEKLASAALAMLSNTNNEGKKQIERDIRAEP